MNYKDTMMIIAVLAFVLIFIALNKNPKLPASVVVLKTDYDTIVTEFLNTGDKDHVFKIELLHFIAEYRRYCDEEETDYQKFEKLIMYFLQEGGDVNLKNSQGETAYDVALKYDKKIAEMIKKAARLENSTLDKIE